jgi:ubiquinone/menaquinone biosynthesis C-methylase UbiE
VIVLKAMYSKGWTLGYKAYDRLAEQYDANYKDNLSLAENIVVFNELKEAIKPTDKIIDLGCGTGLFLEYVKHPPKNYLGIDLSPKMIARAEEKFPEYTFTLGNIEYCEELKNSYYDVALCLFGTPGYSEPTSTAKTISRITDRGSLIYLIYQADVERTQTRASYLAAKNGGEMPFIYPTTPHTIRTLYNEFTPEIRGLNIFIRSLANSMHPPELLANLMTIERMKFGQRKFAIKRAEWITAVGRKNA